MSAELSTFAVTTTAGRITVYLSRHDNQKIHYCFCHEGQRQRGSTKTISEKQARAISQRIVIDEIDGKKKESSPLWLADAIEVCLNDRWPDPQPNDTGYIGTRNRLAVFEKFVTAQKHLDLKVTSEDDMTSVIQSYVDYRRKTLSARSVINDCLVIT